MKQEEYFTQLVREHKSTIYTVCDMFSQDEEEVNDLFQETLINMWKGIDSFREVRCEPYITHGLPPLYNFMF